SGCTIATLARGKTRANASSSFCLGRSPVFGFHSAAEDVLLLQVLCRNLGDALALSDALLHLKLHPHLRHAQVLLRSLRRGEFELRLHVFRQSLRLERLGEVKARAQLVAVLDVARAILCRENNHRKLL